MQTPLMSAASINATQTHQIFERLGTQAFVYRCKYAAAWLIWFITASGSIE